MGKLSQSKKDALIAEILKRKYDDKIDALKKKVFDECTAFIKKEQAGIPFKSCEGYLRKSSRVFVYDESKYSNCAFDFYLPNKIPCKNDAFYFTAKDDKKWGNFVKKHESLLDGKKEDKLILSSALASVNTEKQLFDTLPKMESIYNDLFCGREGVSLIPLETVAKASNILDQIMEAN